MNNQTSRLIEAARERVHKFRLREGSAGSVGAAIRTAQGSVYTGVCVDLSSGLGFCAEVGAMAQMLAHGETHIVEAVALNGRGILSPCGRCRETMAQVDERNLDCVVLLPGGAEVTLRDLLPDHWLPEGEEDEGL
jgi:cytidine deaminase